MASCGLFSHPCTHPISRNIYLTISIRLVGCTSFVLLIPGFLFHVQVLVIFSFKHFILCYFVPGFSTFIQPTHILLHNIPV